MRIGLRTLSWGQIAPHRRLRECYLCLRRSKDRLMWAKLDIKTKFAIVTAAVAFLAGWGLTIAGFLIPPKGEVHDSVLWILGQALIYTASVLGVGMYLNSELTKLRTENQRFKHEVIEKVEGEE